MYIDSTSQNEKMPWCTVRNIVNHPSMSSGRRQKGDTYLRRKHKKEIIVAAKNNVTQMYVQR